MEQIDVIVGTILKGKKSLVERRRLDEKVDPDIVCLPGGHIRKGESREEALKREMLDELGKVNGFMFICKNFYIVSNGERQNAYCYLVTNYEGTPICQSAREIFWEDSIDNLTLEVDKKTIKKLKKSWRATRTNDWQGRAQKPSLLFVHHSQKSICCAFQNSGKRKVRPNQYYFN